MRGCNTKLADEENWTAQSFDEPDRFARQAAHFLDCIAGKRGPLVSGEDGLAVMRVIEMAYESAGVTR